MNGSENTESRTSPRELIRLENVCKTYSMGEVDVPVLKDVSLSIDRGELVALMGPSGSGKTTLMNLLGCLDRPTSGHYWLDGQEMSRLTPNQRALARTAKLGFVFQNFNLLPRTTAVSNVMMPLDYATRRPSLGQSRLLARALLGHVGLAERLDHEPSQMSGGQQQRVAIARALVNRPSLVLADEPTGNLDSHTSVEILRMFRQLNDEGITVVLVTHDPKVAAHSHRVIYLEDGRIVSDGVPPEAVEGATAGLPSSVNTSRGEETLLGKPPVASYAAKSPYDDAPPRPRRWALRAAAPPTLRTAFGALRRNKMRSALTTLGVIIGVGAVIAMMEIGEGSKAALQKTIASMGANVLMVRSGAASSGGVTFGAGSVLTLTPGDAQEILHQCPSVAEIAPIVRARSQLIYGSRNWVPSFIYGTTPSFLAVQDWQNLDEGEMFTQRDVLNGNKVCVIGQTLVRELFQGEYPIGKEMRIQNVSFRVIGVLRRKGANMMGMDQDDIVLAPWTTIKYRVSATTLSDANQSAKTSRDESKTVNSLSDLYPGSASLYPTPSDVQAADTPQPVRFVNIDEIRVKAASAERVPQAIAEIGALLRQRHRIRPGMPDDFNVRDMAEITRALASTSQLMGALLLIVALISLVVGGVGIMNIMLVSVTERTREIGLRMAVGARSYHILRQFLVEAVVLCLFGGAMGIILGRSASLMVSMLLRWPTETSLPAIIAAVAVSATVGVVFGFYPAWKASRLDPIEALRYE